MQDHRVVCLERRVPCTVRALGCAAVVPHNGLTGHLDECPFYTVVCNKCQVTVQRSRFEAHYREHEVGTMVGQNIYGVSIFSCPLRTEGCMDNHGGLLYQCPHYYMSCHACKATMSRSSYEAHRSKCDTQSVPLPHKMPHKSSHETEEPIVGAVASKPQRATRRAHYNVI